MIMEEQVKIEDHRNGQRVTFRISKGVMITAVVKPERVAETLAEFQAIADNYRRGNPCTGAQ